MGEINALNEFMVGISAGKIVVLAPPHDRLTKEAAIRFAAWLVAMADNSEDHQDFNAVLPAIEGS